MLGFRRLEGGPIMDSSASRPAIGSISRAALPKKLELALVRQRPRGGRSAPPACSAAISSAPRSATAITAVARADRLDRSFFSSLTPARPALRAPRPRLSRAADNRLRFLLQRSANRPLRTSARISRIFAAHASSTIRGPPSTAPSSAVLQIASRIPAIPRCLDQLGEQLQLADAFHDRRLPARCPPRPASRTRRSGFRAPRPTPPPPR